MINHPMKLTCVILMVFAGLGDQAAGKGSEFASGREYYGEAEFGKAAAHFQLALKDDPDDAETYYWTGMSYQRLADIALPFGGKYNSKAREYLTKATKLAPSDAVYRQALFNFLLDSANSSRTALRDAAGVLSATSESDPAYSDMRRRLEEERKVNSSANARLGRLFLIVPRAAYGIAALPASALSSRHAATPLPTAEH